MAPRAWLVVWFLGLGCHSAVALQLDGDEGPGARLWDEGQKAMREGRPERAIGFYQKSLALDPAATRNHLSLAAALLETGEDEAACRHLGLYVYHHPDHALMRSHYAELLMRLHRCGEARRQYERFVADAQERPADFARHLVHCHTRLMELARLDEDDYLLHLNRGMGLYWLARERVTAGEPGAELPVEGLLCKAASELKAAWQCRPGEARPCWYLHLSWSWLGQRQTGLVWLHRARAAAPFSVLTPTESRGLHLAAASAEPLPRH